MWNALEPIVQFVIGFGVFSILIGHYITRYFSNRIDYYIRSETEKDIREEHKIGYRNIKSLVGFIERSFFSISVAYNVSGVVIGIILWITVKMFTRADGIKEVIDTPVKISNLSESLVSMIFALLGGLIWRGSIWF